MKKMILYKIMKRIILKLNVFKYGLIEINKIPAHLSFDEKLCLFKLSKKSSGVYVEIGSYIGASTCFIAQGIIKSKYKYKSKLFCVDTWKNDAMDEGAKDTYSCFLENTSRFKDIIIPVREKSEVAVSIIKKKVDHIDFLFIDADHSYEGVMGDWNSYSPFLKSGSLVVFHDYGWAEGVIKVVNENVKPLTLKYEALPNLWWGWIK